MPEQEAWWSVWAKTDRDPQNPAGIAAWLPLHQHLADSAGVAGLLVDNWVSPQVVRRVAADLDGGVADVRMLVTWLAAVHDVGKISPAFTVQVLKDAPGLLDVMRHCGLAVDPRFADDTNRSRVRHEFVGQEVVRTWLADERGFPFQGVAAQLACVVGAHHGVPPGRSEIAYVQGGRGLAGRGVWERERAAALRWATELVGGPDALKAFGDATVGRPAQAPHAAIVIMADWIASNAELFPLDPLPTPGALLRAPDPDYSAERLAVGWRALGLPRRWSPRPVGCARRVH